MIASHAGLDELFSLAVRNLLRARSRLVMTSTGVLVGTTAVTLLIALTIGLQAAAEAGIGQSATLRDIDVYPNYGAPSGTDPGTIPQLTPDSVASFWRIPGVQAVIPTVSLQNAALQADDYFGGAYIFGVDPRLLPYMDLALASGSTAIGENAVLVGAEVARSFYDPEAETYEPITVDFTDTPPELTLSATSGDTRRVRLNPVGEIAPGGRFDYAIVMTLDSVIEYNLWTSGQPFDRTKFVFEQVVVRADSRETASSTAEAIKALGFSVGGAGEYLNQINGFFVVMRVVLGGVGGISLIVAAFGVFNTMTMAILERTREIGLMKAIGARDRDILSVFLCEAGLVGLIGGAGGVTISYLFGNLINTAIAAAPADPNGASPLGFLGINPGQLTGGLIVITPELAMFALGLALGVGLTAGLLPSLRAARMIAVDALRTE